MEPAIVASCTDSLLAFVDCRHDGEVFGTCARQCSGGRCGATIRIASFCPKYGSNSRNGLILRAHTIRSVAAVAKGHNAKCNLQFQVAECQKVHFLKMLLRVKFPV